MAREVLMSVLRHGWPLLAILAWGVLSFGAVYPWAYWPLLLAAAALGLAGVWGDKAWHDPRLRRVLVALAVLAAAIVVQTIALPSWLIVDLSPGVDRFFRQFRIGYHPAELHTLSLDPGATRVVLAEIVALGLLLVGSARLVRRWNLDWVANQTMGLAMAVALIGIVQRALIDSDTDLIYGFWRPRQGGEPFGPFVNRNHFAGWMVMVLPLVGAYAWALAQANARHTGARSWMQWFSGVEGNRVLLVVSCLLIMTVALVMTGSRSGMAAGVVGMLVLLFFLWRTISGAPRVVVTVLVLAVLSGAMVWAGAGSVMSRFGRASEDAGGRVSAWQDTLRIASDFPLFGTGLGGYRRAMLIYQTRDREAIYAQAHNDYLQLLAEGGALVTVPVVVLVGIIVTGVARRLRASDDNPMTYWIRRGAVAGVVGMAAQSVVEFSLQMPGNAAMFVALTAIALHRPRVHSHAHRV
jgi:hypothetical protein